MVSLEKKTGYSFSKLGKAAGKIIPILKREKPSDFVNEILKEDEYIRLKVEQNPAYMELLEQKAKEIFAQYRGVIYGSKVIDTWDRVTSAMGLIGDTLGPVTDGAGNAFSALEEIPELIPKALYSIYYLLKTGDWKAIPCWGFVEAASFIPYLGDAIDMTNIYVGRARKITKDKVKEEFRKMLKSGLEKKLTLDDEEEL